MTYRSRAELEAAVAAHLPDWWRNDPGVAAELVDRPNLLAQLEARGPFVSTVHVYADGDAWRPARVAVHGSILAAMLATGDLPPAPVAYFTIGPMGAGKTTKLRPIVRADRARRGLHDESLSRVCADDIRADLPEYADGLGSLVVQEEAFIVAYDALFPAARDAGHDVVYDTIGRVVGSGASFDRQLRELKTAGFAVHVLLADCPLDLCRTRADQRALSNGRLVDPAVQDATHDQPARVLKLLQDEDGLLDGWAVFDTSRPGDPPRMVDGTQDWRAAGDDLHTIILDFGLNCGALGALERTHGHTMDCEGNG